MTEQAILPEVQLDIHSLDGPAFRERLVAIRNIVVPDEPVTGFDAGKNAAGGGLKLTGEVEGKGHRYPHASDKAELIDYGLAAAQRAKDPHDQSIAISATVVIVHPFAEGSGRTSRDLYEHLETGKPFSTPNREPGTLQDDAARARIDLGSVWDEQVGIVPAIRDREVCRKTGVDYERMSHSRVNVVLQDEELDDVQRATLGDDEKRGLTEEEIYDITDAIGADSNGNIYGRDSKGLNYAAASINDNELVQRFSTQVGRTHVFDLRSFLREASIEDKKVLIGKLWEYRKEAARTSIDLLSDEGGGSQQVEHEGRQTTLRDYIVSRMNHLPRGRSDGDLLGQAAVAAQRAVE